MSDDAAPGPSEPTTPAGPPPYGASSPTPPPYVPPAPPAASSAPAAPAAPAPGRLGGLAIAAIVVGGIAFLSGPVPFFGALLGLLGGLLGLFALLRGQSKPLSIISIVLSGLALLTSVGITIAVILATVANGAGSAAPSAPAPAPASSSVESSAPVEPTPTPTASVTDAGSFALEAHNQTADLTKDLNDMVERTQNAQMIRLLGNAVELSFNLGQLQALEAPESIRAEWNDSLVALQASIDTVTTAATRFTSDAISVDEMLAAIEATRAQVAAVDAIASKIG